MITKEQALSRFEYFPDTGDILDRRSNAVAGNIEVTKTTAYRRIYAFNQTLRGHQIAWLIYYGVWPSGEVDHKDGNGLNNRIENLRDGTRSQNQRNQKLGRKNKSGVLGVSWHTKSGRWQVHIWIEGKRKHIGYYKRLKHAHAARAAAASAHGYSR